MKRIAFISVFLSLLSASNLSYAEEDLWRPEFMEPIKEQETPISNTEKFKIISCESVKLEEKHENLPKQATSKCKEQFDETYKSCSEIKIADPIIATGAPLNQLKQQVISVRKGFKSQLDGYLNCKESVESNIKTCEQEIETSNSYISENSEVSNPENMAGNVDKRKKEVEGSKEIIKFLNEDGEKDTLQNNANCVIKKSFDSYYALHQNLKFAIQDLDTGSKYTDTPRERNNIAGNALQVNNTTNTTIVNIGAPAPSADVGAAATQVPIQSSSPLPRASNVEESSAAIPPLISASSGANSTSAANLSRAQLTQEAVQAAPAVTAGQAADAGISAMMRNEIAKGYTSEDYANVIRPIYKDEDKRGVFIKEARENGGLTPEAHDGLKLVAGPSGPKFDDLLRPSEAAYVEGVGMVDGSGNRISNENIMNVSGSGDPSFDRLDADLRKTLWLSRLAPYLDQSYYVDFCNKGQNRRTYAACSRYR
jgi:hypothetical protein